MDDGGTKSRFVDKVVPFTGSKWPIADDVLLLIGEWLGPFPLQFSLSYEENISDSDGLICWSMRLNVRNSYSTCPIGSRHPWRWHFWINVISTCISKTSCRWVTTLQSSSSSSSLFRESARGLLQGDKSYKNYKITLDQILFRYMLRSSSLALFTPLRSRPIHTGKLPWISSAAALV